MNKLVPNNTRVIHTDLAEPGVYYPGEFVMKKEGGKVRPIFGTSEPGWVVVGVVTEKQEITKWFHFWKKKNKVLKYESGKFETCGMTVKCL
jgi:hypothetical protein